MNNKIQEFNKWLVDESIDINIIQYVIELNEDYFQIDIEFIDDFMDLVDKDECCVNHAILQKYGVSALSNGSNDVKKLIERNKGRIDQDYTVRHLADREDYSHKIEYFLHPTFFKKILIRSQNTEKYADYYILLEKCIKYYNDYQIMKLKHTIEENNKLKLLKLKKQDTLDRFIIVYDKSRMIFPYGFIRGSPKNLRETLNDLHLTEDDFLLNITVPSQTNFSKRVTEELKDKFKREKVYVNKTTKQKYYEEEDDDGPAFEDNELWTCSVTRWFKLNSNITIDDFINLVKNLNDERFC